MLQEANAVIIQWGVVLGASLAAALWDLKDRRIPNMLTVPVFISGLVWSFVMGGGAGLLESFEAAVILALPYVLLFLFAGGGAGDAKIMAAVGTWLGLHTGIVALVSICVFGIILALLKALWHRQFFSVLKSIRVMLFTFFVYVTSRGGCRANALQAAEGGSLTIPYGPAIFAGVLTAAIYTLATN